ncbi:Gfo/Idh/MocA family oxidoreductase [Dermatophilaceae bacterium Soc4.6]
MPVIRFGLVGAGPWAERFHAPMIAGSPGVELAGVWARRAEAAVALAAPYGARVSSSYDDLLAHCDAVAFAVPPDVQADLAPRAARAGRHLLLEKPLAFTVAGAQEIVDAVDAAGVTSLLMVRNRFDPAVVELLHASAEVVTRGVVARFVSGAALPGETFATPWRQERGALFDLAPHALDLIEALLGPVEGITATGDPKRWVGVTTRHTGGAVGQVALSLTVPGVEGQLRLDLVHDGGVTSLGPLLPDEDETVPRAIMAAFVGAVASGRSHELDAHRGLMIQRLLEGAGATG